MRLLYTSTLELQEYYGETIPRYAILSHTWGDVEVSFQQLQGSKPNKLTELDASNGGRKIKAACKRSASPDLTRRLQQPRANFFKAAFGV